MARRVSINIPGFAHKNPIPAGCRIGKMVYSSSIHGLDPATGKLAEGLDAQVAMVFAHMRAIVEAAGGTTEDIVKVTIWLRDRELRTVLNVHWLGMFPDPENRPARHVMRGNLDGDMQVQGDFTAILP